MYENIMYDYNMVNDSKIYKFFSITNKLSRVVLCLNKFHFDFISLVDLYFLSKINVRPLSFPLSLKVIYDHHGYKCWQLFEILYYAGWNGRNILFRSINKTWYYLILKQYLSERRHEIETISFYQKLKYQHGLRFWTSLLTHGNSQILMFN